MGVSFYDVVVVGLRLGALAAGALLARRGFRVLLIGHDDLPAAYPIETPQGPISLYRTPFTVTAADSPALRRVFTELALSQTFRRRATALDPCMQVVLPRHRIDYVGDAAELEREIKREFPEVERPIADLYDRLGRWNEAIDRMVERDLVWPPDSFLERREFARAGDSTPFGKRGDEGDLFAEFPEGHPFRLVVHAQTRFADQMDPDHTSPLRLARLHGASVRGTASLEGGLDGLRRILMDKIRTHSGEVREKERAHTVVLKRGRVSGLRFAVSDEAVGCNFVLSSSPTSAVLRLLPDRGPFDALFERTGEPQARYYRYALSVVLPTDALPAGMGREVYFVRDSSRRLADENLLYVRSFPSELAGLSVVTAEALLSRRGIEDVEGYLPQTRERVIGALREIVPFLDQNALYIDSPFDGRPLRDVRERRDIAMPDPWHRAPERMQAVFGYPVVRNLGVCAMSVRSPIKGLLLCGAQVVPGFGVEGEFLAAWTAAGIITRTDRQKERMRRELWSKVEI